MWGDIFLPTFYGLYFHSSLHTYFWWVLIQVNHSKQLYQLNTDKSLSPIFDPRFRFLALQFALMVSFLALLIYSAIWIRPNIPAPKNIVRIGWSVISFLFNRTILLSKALHVRKQQKRQWLISSKNRALSCQENR